MSNCAVSVGRRFLCESCVERAIEFGLLCDEPLQLCFGLCALATRQDASCEFGAKFLDLVVDVEHVPLLCLKTRGLTVPERAGSRIAKATGGGGEGGSQNAEHFGGTARPRRGPLRHGTVGSLKRQTGLEARLGLNLQRAVRTESRRPRQTGSSRNCRRAGLPAGGRQ